MNQCLFNCLFLVCEKKVKNYAENAVIQMNTGVIW